MVRSIVSSRPPSPAPGQQTDGTDASENERGGLGGDAQMLNMPRVVLVVCGRSGADLGPLHAPQRGEFAVPGTIEFLQAPEKNRSCGLADLRSDRY
jgi:hypothetical protein